MSTAILGLGFILVVIGFGNIIFEKYFKNKEIEEKFETYKKSHEILMNSVDEDKKLDQEFENLEKSKNSYSIKNGEKANEIYQKIKNNGSTDNTETVNTIGRLKKMIQTVDEKRTYKISCHNGDHEVVEELDELKITGHNNDVTIKAKVSSLIITGHNNDVDSQIPINTVKNNGHNNDITYSFSPVSRFLHDNYSGNKKQLKTKTFTKNSSSVNKIYEDFDVFNIECHASYFHFYGKIGEIVVNGNGNVIWLYEKPEKFTNNGNNSIYKKY